MYNEYTEIDRNPDPSAKPTFCLKQFEETSFHSVKRPTMALLGGKGLRVGFGTIFQTQTKVVPYLIRMSCIHPSPVS